MELPYNPISMPKTEDLISQLVRLVNKCQDKKGYIDLQNQPNNDSIIACVWVDDSNVIDEFYVKAIRVNKQGELQIVYDLFEVTYDEEAFADEDNWQDILDYGYPGIVLWPTLMNLSEFLWEYVDWPEERPVIVRSEFPLTSISREDLEAVGLDPSETDDETMTSIASKMTDDILNQMYWTSMEIIAEERYNVPRKIEEHA